jgi:hypothetical protein
MYKIDSVDINVLGTPLNTAEAEITASFEADYNTCKASINTAMSNAYIDAEAEILKLAVELRKLPFGSATETAWREDLILKASKDQITSAAILTKGITVKAATTANITLSGIKAIDGVTLVAGDRVLVKNQTNKGLNGLYVIASTAWKRTDEANSIDELQGTVIVNGVKSYQGISVFVDKGTVNKNTKWTSTSRITTLNTTAIVFTKTANTGVYITTSVKSFVTQLAAKRLAMSDMITRSLTAVRTYTSQLDAINTSNQNIIDNEYYSHMNMLSTTARSNEYAALVDATPVARAEYESITPPTPPDIRIKREATWVYEHHGNQAWGEYHLHTTMGEVGMRYDAFVASQLAYCQESMNYGALELVDPNTPTTESFSEVSGDGLPDGLCTMAVTATDGPTIASAQMWPTEDPDSYTYEVHVIGHVTVSVVQITNYYGGFPRENGKGT